MVHVGSVYWYRLFGAGLLVEVITSYWYRLTLDVVDSVIVTGCLHLAFIFHGGWRGQGQVVVATFQLYLKNIGGCSLLLVVAIELGSWSVPRVVA
jgi:hypothetical protein